jgi:7-cyano-7-deazaguanine tRNA-ribosyltransferase
MKFEIKNRDANARICNFYTNHGVIKTPTLLPVINPNKMILSPMKMKKLFGVEMIITNSYIIKTNDKLRVHALEKGVHDLLDFDGPIMTDSGTFQSYVYGDVKVDPLEIVEFQRDIGSDVGTILDIFGTPDQSKSQAKKGVLETVRRAKDSIKIKGDMILACTIQGSIYPDLRLLCASKLNDANADFYPIGGVVPLMENQRYSDLIRAIIASKEGVNQSKPIHLFGAGHPIIFPLAVALGCDFFDSSAYVKYANDDRLIFPENTMKLADLDELPCSCPICSKYTAKELKNEEKSDRVLQIMKHNLYISFSELKKIRTAIVNGNLWELVERKANANPYLIDAMIELRKRENKKWIEQFEIISKNKALFYTGIHTIDRPLIFRILNRLNDRYSFTSDKYILLPETKKPYSKYYHNEIFNLYDENKDLNILVKSPLGSIPIELDEMYPFAQSIFPDNIDSYTRKIVNKNSKKFLEGKKEVTFKIKKDVNNKSVLNNEIEKYFDIRKISSTADMQFAKNASKSLFNGNIKIVKSKKTGKIRNIYCNNKHILSMRAGDGMFTLKIEGGIKLHDFFKFPSLRVIIKDDAVPFIINGKSVFSKFVDDCDINLRPFDECIIVDKKDTFLGVGKCHLNRIEMLSFNFGMAVKVREHIRSL